MSTLNILGNTSEQADSIRLMLKVRGMKDGRFIDADPLIILKADNHQKLQVRPLHGLLYGFEEDVRGQRTETQACLCVRPGQHLG